MSDRAGRRSGAAGGGPRFVVGWTAVVIGSGCAGGAEPEGARSLAIVSAAVLPMDRDTALVGHSVVVRDGRIVRVAPGAHEAADTVVVCPDCYVFPGLVDAHVHLDHPDELGLYPAYGVTTLVNLRGDPRHRDPALRDGSAAFVAPRVFSAGENLSGDPPDFALMQSLGDTGSLRRAVEFQARGGVDVIKLYDGLDADAVRHASLVANALGKPVFAHLPDPLGLHELRSLGVDNVAHGEELLPLLRAHGIDAVVDALAASGASLTANLAFLASIVQQGRDPEALLSLPEAGFLPAASFQTYRPAFNRFVGRDSAYYRRTQESVELLRATVRRAHEAGVPVLAGTDASTVGSYPGHSLWVEIAELAEGAGLGRYAALRSATAVAGEELQRLGLSDEPSGVVAPGYAADLVVSRIDPRARPIRPGDVHAVIVGGRVVSGARLDEQIARSAARRTRAEPAVHRLEGLLRERRGVDALELYRSQAALVGDSVLVQHYVLFGTALVVGEQGLRGGALGERRLADAAALMRMYSLSHPSAHASRLFEAWYAAAAGDTATAKIRLAEARLRAPEDVRYTHLERLLAQARGPREERRR